MHPCILLSIKNNKGVSHGTPKNRCILLLLEKVQALDYDIIGPITLLHQFLFRFCFVCVSGLQTVIQILMVLAQIGSLVSWSDHLMTYINRLMDHRGRILYSPEWETAEAAVLVFFVFLVYCFGCKTIISHGVESSHLTSGQWILMFLCLLLTCGKV